MLHVSEWDKVGCALAHLVSIMLLLSCTLNDFLQHFDTDNSGYITKEELEAAFTDQVHSARQLAGDIDTVLAQVCEKPSCWIGQLLVSTLAADAVSASLTVRLDVHIFAPAWVLVLAADIASSVWLQGLIMLALMWAAGGLQCSVVYVLCVCASEQLVDCTVVLVKAAGGLRQQLWNLLVSSQNQLSFACNSTSPNASQPSVVAAGGQEP